MESTPTWVGFEHEAAKKRYWSQLRARERSDPGFSSHASYVKHRRLYVDGVWQISPGNPNPDCDCGTGTCKRSVISQWRAAHPSACCVHIGNGRVSDTCGAIAADLAFAKETLAEELERRGVGFERFHDLNDVVASLESRARDLDA